jgi:inner membrane protein
VIDRAASRAFLWERAERGVVYRLGHYGVSLLLYAPIGFAFVFAGEPALGVVGGAGVLALARVPDYDQRVPGITHRGVTHTLAFALLVGAAFAGALVALTQAGSDPMPAVEVAPRAAFAFGVGAFGILAHLAGDVLTPAGVPLLWPVSGRRYTVSLTTADSTLWNYLLFALGVFATAVAGLVAVNFL